MTISFIPGHIAASFMQVMPSCPRAYPGQTTVKPAAGNNPRPSTAAIAAAHGDVGVPAGTGAASVGVATSWGAAAAEVAAEATPSAAGVSTSGWTAAEGAGCRGSGCRGPGRHVGATGRAGGFGRGRLRPRSTLDTDRGGGGRC